MNRSISFFIFLTLIPMSYITAAENSHTNIQERHNFFMDQFYTSLIVNPYTYHTAYNENQFSADKKYKNQWVTFEGVVSRVSKNRQDEPVISIVVTKGMSGIVTLQLFPDQIISHDESGYHSAPSSYLVENLFTNEKIIANCRGTGIIDGGPSADNCLVYSSDDYNKIYQLKPED